MKILLDTIFIKDTIISSLPADKFIKSGKDTTPEMKSAVYPEKHQEKSYFTGHQLQARSREGIPFGKYQPDWILGMILLCFLLLAWVQLYFRKRFRQVFLAPYSKRFLNQLIRDGNLFRERITLVMVFVYLVCFSLVLYEMNDLKAGGFIPWSLNSFTFYLCIMLVVTFYWVSKVFFIRLLGIVFKTPATTHEYLLNILILMMVTGIVLLPVVVVIVYLKSILALYISLILIILLFIFRFFRGYLIGLTLTKFSYLYLFVYLCTLEIIPLIILSKLYLLVNKILI